MTIHINQDLVCGFVVDVVLLEKYICCNVFAEARRLSKHYTLASLDRLADSGHFDTKIPRFISNISFIICVKQCTENSVCCKFPILWVGEFLSHNVYSMVVTHKGWIVVMHPLQGKPHINTKVTNGSKGGSEENKSHIGAMMVTTGHYGRDHRYANPL